MINVVVLQGRLTHTPELKTTPSGSAVCSFSIANDRSYVKAGEPRKTDFYDVVAWRNTAEFICRYFSKGQGIGITGHLQTSEYTDRNGNTRKRVEVYADAVDFVGDRSAAEKPKTEEQAPETGGAFTPIDVAPDDEDLPF